MSSGGSLKQTHVAFIGTNFARAFTVHFVDHPVSGYTPFLQEPQTQSTGGGALARQPLVLRPPGGGAAIPIGWVNVATKECQIRSYACLVSMHKRRFPDTELALDAHEYDRFLNQARAFFGQREMKIAIEEQAAEVDTSAAAVAKRAPVVPIVAALVALLAMVLVAYVFVR